MSKPVKNTQHASPCLGMGRFFENYKMAIVIYVRIFLNGRNQMLRTPKEFDLEGDEAIVRSEGYTLILIENYPLNARLQTD
jgi:hypothetical protein